MAGRTLPGLGLKGDWSLGEDNWKDENDLNLLTLSVLTQGRVLSMLAAVPPAPAEGAVHILTAAPNINSIAVFDEGAWRYFPAVAGMTMFNVGDGKRYEFKNGAAAWTELVTSGGGGGGGSSDLKLIGYVESDGTRLIFNFANIPQDFQDLELRCMFRVADPALSTSSPIMRVNGIATAQYDRQRQYSGNTSTTSEQALAQTSWSGCLIAEGGNAEAGMFSPNRIEMLGYSKAGMMKNFLATCRWAISGGVVYDGYIMDSNGQSRDTAPITALSIEFTVATAAGSYVALYGRGQGLPVIAAPAAGVATLVVEESPASFTLAMADLNKYKRSTSAAAMNVTVPPNSAVAFPIGSQVHVAQAGAGQVTFVAGAGVNINSAETLKLRKLYSTATLVKVAADSWDLAGDLELLP